MRVREKKEMKKRGQSLKGEETGSKIEIRIIEGLCEREERGGRLKEGVFKLLEERQREGVKLHEKARDRGGEGKIKNKQGVVKGG